MDCDDRLNIVGSRANVVEPSPAKHTDLVVAIVAYCSMDMQYVVVVAGGLQMSSAICARAAKQPFERLKSPSSRTARIQFHFHLS